MFVLWLAVGRARDGVRDRRQPELDAPGSTRRPRRAAGGNMEGKEVRFGPAACGLFAASTTGTSTGAVNAMHDSFTPIGGAVPLVNMMLGEVSPGGVGSGLYGMLVFALLVGVHRRAHGRPNARVPRQEDPGGRDEARRALHPRRAVAGPRVRAAISVVLDERAQGVDPQPRTARPHRDRLRVHVGGEQQRLGVRRAHRQHRLVQHDARARDARRPVPADHPGARDRRLARPQAAGARRRPARSRPTRRCSPGCSSASS